MAQTLQTTVCLQRALTPVMSVEEFIEDHPLIDDEYRRNGPRSQVLRPADFGPQRFLAVSSGFGD